MDTPQPDAVRERSVAIQVRALDPGDAQAYWALRQQALREWPPAFSSLPETEPGPTELANRLVASEQQVFFGAFAGEPLVGSVRLTRFAAANEQHRAYLGGLYVEPTFRGQGCGRALVRAALGQAAAWPGLRRVSLTVVSGQAAALRLYESAGFRVYGTEPESFWRGGQYYDEHLMTLALSAGKAAPG